MKGLIIAPGLDNYLAIHCLNTERPDVIAFIIDEETVELLPEILEKSEHEPQEYKKFFIKDLSSPAEAVQEFLNAFYWLTEVKKIKKITVDASNVLSVTSFSVYFIASFIEVFKDLVGEDADIKLIFTNCDWKVIEADAHAAGAPIIGTERIIELDDPTNTIGFILGITACDLFNKGFYSRAEEIFKMLSKKTKGEQNLLYNSLASSACAYNLWDKFDVGAAQEELERTIQHLGRVTKFSFIKDIVPKLNSGIEVLKEINAGNQLEEIVDMFENGNRKMQRGIFDDAVARYYRCLDMIAQYALGKYGIDTVEPDFSKLSPEVVEKYKKERGGALPEKYKEGVGGIALKNAFLLLYCIGDLLGQEYKKIEAKFIGLLTARNQSILAHGLKPITKEKAEKFRDEMVRPFLEKLFDRENLNLEQTLKRHQYPKLSTNIKNLFLDLKKI